MNFILAATVLLLPPEPVRPLAVGEGISLPPVTSAESADLPRTRGVSRLDAVGWRNVLPKIAAGTEAVVSRQDLEYIARASGGELVYEGQPQRVPAGWKHLPPLVQPVRFEPAITALAVFGNRARLVKIASLEALRFFTRNPDGNVPLRFRLPPGARGALALVLLTRAGAEGISRDRIAVTASTASGRWGGEEWTRTVTQVDLDGDGQPEIAHVRRQARNPALCVGGGYGCSSERSYLALRYRGAWYKSAEIRDGQDGPEGF